MKKEIFLTSRQAHQETWQFSSVWTYDLFGFCPVHWRIQDLFEVQSHHRSTRFLISLCGEFSSEAPEKLLCIFYFKIMVKSQETHVINLHQVPTLGFLCGSAGQESTCHAGELDSTPGLGRLPGEGKGCPLQYSGLENSMNCIDHGVAKGRTWLSAFHFHFKCLLTAVLGEGAAVTVVGGVGKVLTLKFPVWKSPLANLHGGFPNGVFFSSLLHSSIIPVGYSFPLLQASDPSLLWKWSLHHPNLKPTRELLSSARQLVPAPLQIASYC